MFNLNGLLAAFDPIGLVSVMIPIIALMIPIVALLSKHQRDMAELIHKNHAQTSNNDIQAVRQEISELKEIVHQLAISVDSQPRIPMQTPPAPHTETREIQAGL